MRIGGLYEERLECDSGSSPLHIGTLHAVVARQCPDHTCSYAQMPYQERVLARTSTRQSKADNFIQSACNACTALVQPSHD